MPFPRTVRFSHLTRRRAFGATLAAGVVALCSCASAGAAPSRETWAFMAFWDTRSAESLRRHAAAIDVAVTTWIALDSVTGSPTVLHEAPATSTPAGVRTVALVTSWFGDRFHPGSVLRLAADSARLRAASAFVAQRAAALGHAGLVLDLEAHAPADRVSLLRVIRSVAGAARAAGMAHVVVAIPASDTAAYPARPILDAGATAVLPMLYDQHWAGGVAGPVADPAWVRRWLRVRVDEVGAQAVIAALPLYGYHWPRPNRGETVGFAEAVRRADSAGVRLERDAASGTLRARLGPTGEIWVSDAALLATLLRIAQESGVRRIALWRLGEEDPAVWGVLR